MRVYLYMGKRNFGQQTETGYGRGQGTSDGQMRSAPPQGREDRDGSVEKLITQSNGEPSLVQDSEYRVRDYVSTKKC